MPEQETAGPQPESALMYALRDAFRRDLDALLTTGARTAAVRTRWAIFADQTECHHTAEDSGHVAAHAAKLAHDPDGLAVVDETEAEHAQDELPPACVAEPPPI